MIVITTVYVIATIFICIFNYKSSKSTNEQLLEMKKQYNEEFRPFLKIEKQDRKHDEIVFKIKNIGIRSAFNISVEFKQHVDNFEGSERCISGGIIEILRNEKSLQPQNDILYSLRNHILVGMSLKLDAILKYESSRGNEFEERVCVDVGGPVYNNDVHFDVYSY